MERVLEGIRDVLITVAGKMDPTMGLHLLFDSIDGGITLLEMQSFKPRCVHLLHYCSHFTCGTWNARYTWSVRLANEQ